MRHGDDAGGCPERVGEDPADLFVYGELCRSEVLWRVLDRVPAAVPALLLEHRRARNPETGYFEAYPSPGGYVSGLLLRQVAEGELATIDRFERVDDGLYRRAVGRVRMMGEGNREVDAWVYLGGASGGGNEAAA